MEVNLKGTRVAILVEHGFDQRELQEPRQVLDAAGARTMIVSPVSGEVRAWRYNDWGDFFPVDVNLHEAGPDDFDALFLPGGVMSPDRLRLDRVATVFVRGFFDRGKPIAAICHGPWMLVEADIVRELTVTSWPSLRTDIRNAGGIWVDEEVVTDQGIVTSRKPDDIPAFNRKMIEEFREGRHEMRQAA